MVLDISGNPKLGPSLDSQDLGCYSLVDLDQLEILRARRVGIRRLPVPLIERLTALRVLDVAENDIDAIPESAAVAVTRLHELNLANNRLVKLSTLAESLSWRGGSDMARRSLVNLAGNPWHCTCSDVPACRRLTTILDNPSHHWRHSAPRCVSLEVRSSGQSVLEFCRDMIAAADNNRTTSACLDATDFEQRVVEETANTRTLTLAVISVVIVLLTVSVSMACCRLSRRNTRQRSRRSTGSARRNGYRIVGETALDFTDVQ